MSHLEKIQKVMKVLKILSKVILIILIVGVALSSIAALLVASNVLNAGNQFLHFVFVPDGLSKGQIVGTLAASAVSLLFEGIPTALAYRYFAAELKEGTPFTHAGADRLKQLGIITIVLSLAASLLTEGISNALYLAEEWHRYDNAGGVTLGLCLLFLSVIARYGAELEKKNRA
ncbi:MAG: hypothetical protein NC432_08910 [Roseburia sp.]|nr:hypothetical protein [Roseburia sp.]MCM1099426.1 hypothetical protein [Ruminococcus flavefaciens]